jgi:hypothetical protein
MTTPVSAARAAVIDECVSWVTTAHASLQAGDIASAAVQLALAADLALEEAAR